jgi:AAA+ ATPase superfamily predicted ATPase
MLFSTEPKDSLKDLFDREHEVKALKDGLNERLVLVLGLRRTGKSSLVRSTLNSIDVNTVVLDVRKAYDEISKKVTSERLLEELHSSMLKLDLKEKLKDLYSRLEITLESPLRVKLSPRNLIKDFVEVLEMLNDNGKTVIAFDEAQYMRFSTIGMRSIMAYVYDNLKNVTLVLTGSEVGLLYDFIGLNNPDAELYGRYYKAVNVDPFDRKMSKEFLVKGFVELGVNFDEKTVEEAAEELGGIPGWLVYFGKLYEEKGKNALNEVKEIGSELVKRELESIFARSSYYLYILKAIAVSEKASWKNIVDYVTVKTGSPALNATISRDINNLLKMGFIKKEIEGYAIADPIVRYTVLKKF